MKKSIFSIQFILLTLSGFSQYIDQSYFQVVERGWQTEGNINLTLSQVYLSNWVGGGQASISVGSMFNYTANYRRGPITWRNNIEATYGLMRQGEQQMFRKTDDYLILRSQYGRRINDNLKITTIMDFRTQFTKGWNYNETGRTNLISDLMAPGFLQFSLGLTYSKQEFYTVTFSPIAGKFTFVLNDSLSAIGAFGVNEGQRLRAEGGTSFRGTFQKDIFENVRLRSNLLLFSNYSRIQNVDVNWEAFLIMRINKYITSNISAQLIYDDDIRIMHEDGTETAEVQFKNVINIGFAFEF
ncbi:DUF3078 domain-containing protein [soil metagenome]